MCTIRGQIGNARGCRRSLRTFKSNMRRPSQMLMATAMRYVPGKLPTTHDSTAFPAGYNMQNAKLCTHAILEAGIQMIHKSSIAYGLTKCIELYRNFQVVYREDDDVETEEFAVACICEKR
ncbi:hypothetical protein MAR_022454, partial [Mya arenaria]